MASDFLFNQKKKKLEAHLHKEKWNPTVSMSFSPTWLQDLFNFLVTFYP